MAKPQSVTISRNSSKVAFNMSKKATEEVKENFSKNLSKSSNCFVIPTLVSLLASFSTAGLLVPTAPAFALAGGELAANKNLIQSITSPGYGANIADIATNQKQQVTVPLSRSKTEVVSNFSHSFREKTQFLSNAPEPILLAAAKMPAYQLQLGDNLDKVLKVDRLTPNVATQVDQTTGNLATQNLHQELTVGQYAEKSHSQNYSSNPYVEQLKAAVAKLRLDYAQQKVIDSSSSQTRKAAVVNGNSLGVDSEIFPAPLTFNFPLSAAYAAKIARRPNKKANLKLEEEVVATNSLSPEVYQQLLQTSIGKKVSTSLPPLSSPEKYLPSSPPPIFNGYIWPAKGVYTSGYGRRWGRMHRGIDIAAPIGTPVVAAAAGQVVSAGWNSGGFGNVVKLKHPDGSMTLYAHNKRILVRKGQQVMQGQRIAEMGNSGRSTGPHLHFEIHPKGRGARNPIAYLPKRR